MEGVSIVSVQRESADQVKAEITEALLANPKFTRRVSEWDDAPIMLKCQRGHDIMSIEVMQHNGSGHPSSRWRLDVVTREREYFTPDDQRSRRADPAAELEPTIYRKCGKPACENKPAPGNATCTDHGNLKANELQSVRQRFHCPTCANQGRKTDIVLRQDTLLKLYGVAVITGKRSIKLDGQIMR